MKEAIAMGIIGGVSAALVLGTLYVIQWTARKLWARTRKFTGY